MTPQTKPFDTYFGGKSGSGTYQTIINQIPPHHTYVEPFVGGGAIFRHKREARCSLLNDVDLSIVDRWVKAGIPERNQMKQISESVQIFARDAIDWLGKDQAWLDFPEAFIYVDPPYPHSSRKSDTRYPCEMTDDQHRQLLDVLHQYRHARIAISTYPNGLYEACLPGWRVAEFESQTRKGMATEHLYMNYPEPAELHDYRYIGQDYRERERIAKKVRRHIAKFNNLPALERKALLSALNQTEA